MIKVLLNTQSIRETIIVEEDTTIKEVLENKGVDYTTSQIMLDGSNLPVGGLNKTFSSYDITDKCILAAIVKTQNA